MEEALECARYNAGRAESAYLGYGMSVSDDDAAMGICEAIVNIEFDFRRRRLSGQMMREPESNRIIRELVTMGQAVLECGVLSAGRRELLEKTLAGYQVSRPR